MKPYSTTINYYLQPINIKNQQNFLVVKCLSKKAIKKIPAKFKKNKTKPAVQLCEVFSPVYFSVSEIESAAVDLEKWDNYYLGLDIGVFVAAFIKKIRNWVWRNPVGRVVGALVLSLEISDFITQGKQGVLYATIYSIDKKQAEKVELQNNTFYKSENAASPNAAKQNLNVLRSEQLIPNKSWVHLKGFDKNLINKLLIFFENKNSQN